MGTALARPNKLLTCGVVKAGDKTPLDTRASATHWRRDHTLAPRGTMLTLAPRPHPHWHHPHAGPQWRWAPAPGPHNGARTLAREHARGHRAPGLCTGTSMLTHAWEKMGSFTIYAGRFISPS
ncbi:hypothetical protein O6H91_03G053100 [Diphasiastrum complanatum]|uniref:Uncharacterized protein n=1 Tax=Diphasiastrum complanatum TaxID=34168 RepID=A0ACC2E6B3_DIPCM|nr:hypothetical protein O6H91_03G053100 [Diphasiastrum complanatum]